MQASPLVQRCKLTRQTHNHHAEQAIADPHKQIAMVSQSSYKTQPLLRLTFAFVGVLVTHNLCSLESSILCEGLGQNVIIDLIAHVTHKYPEIILSPFWQSGIVPLLTSSCSGNCFALVYLGLTHFALVLYICLHVPKQSWHLMVMS